VTAWKVVADKHHIDTVYYDPSCDAEYVKKSLIDHDGYPSNISVRKDYGKNKLAKTERQNLQETRRP